jgi:hypothetical protein
VPINKAFSLSRKIKIYKQWAEKTAQFSQFNGQPQTIFRHEGTSWCLGIRHIGHKKIQLINKMLKLNVD